MSPYCPSEATGRQENGKAQVASAQDQRLPSSSERAAPGAFLAYKCPYCITREGPDQKDPVNTVSWWSNNQKAGSWVTSGGGWSAGSWGALNKVEGCLRDGLFELHKPWPGRSSVWVPQRRWCAPIVYRQSTSSKDPFANWKILPWGANCLRMELTWQIWVRANLVIGFTGKEMTLKIKWPGRFTGPSARAPSKRARCCGLKAVRLVCGTVIGSYLGVFRSGLLFTAGRKTRKAT